MNSHRYSIRHEYSAALGPQFHVNYHPMQGTTHTLATYTTQPAAELVISALRAAQSDLK